MKNLRFRPIIMTSMAFILGMIPLVVARGAGAASQLIGVMGGMPRHFWQSFLFLFSMCCYEKWFGIRSHQSKLSLIAEAMNPPLRKGMMKISS